MMLRLSLVLFSLFFAFSTQAQKNGYMFGYVVLNGGDTLKGQLKHFGNVRSCSVVKFINRQGRKTKFYPGDISAYQRGLRIFHSKPNDKQVNLFGSGLIFKELLVDGPVKLYEYFFSSQGAMMMNGPGGGMTSTSTVTQVYDVYQNGRKESVKRVPFRKWAHGYFTGNPKISERIWNREFRYFDLPDLVREYNRWLAGK